MIYCCCSETREQAAAKVAPIKEDVQLYNFQTEIQILHDLHHDNMTNFVAAFYDEGNLWILIEFCAGGSINDVLKKRNGGLTEQV